MTEKTDIKALQRPIRKNHDWSKAVWTDCDHCGEAHTGTVLADDEARICAGCCDAEYYSAWEDLAERAIKLLEAERQRADELESVALALRDDMRVAREELSALRGLHDGLTSEIAHSDRCIAKISALEAELASLRGTQEPVASGTSDQCSTDVYEKGVTACVVAIPKETAEEICRGITASSGVSVDWHYVGGRVHIKTLRTRKPKPVVVLPEIEKWRPYNEVLSQSSYRRMVAIVLEGSGIVVKGGE